MKPRIYLIAVLALLLTTPVIAQTGEDHLMTLAPSEDGKETIGEFVDRLEKAALAGYQPMVAEAAGAVTETAAEMVAAQPSTPVADGFATRVHNSLANFLPLFEFAVDAVSTAEDQESFTVNFNPIRVGAHGAINLNAIVAEPEPYQPLLEAIAESARPAQEEALKGMIDDFGDINWTATYGYQRSAEDKIWANAPKMFGRNAELYEDLVRDLMTSVWEKAYPEDTDNSENLSNYEEKLALRLGKDPDENFDVLAVPFEDVEKALSPAEVEDYIRELRADARIFRDMNEALDMARLDQLAAMIDNQPQLTVTASYRDRDDLAGPDSFSSTVRYELGSRNFNRALKIYRQKTTTWQAKQDDGQDAGMRPTPLDAYLAVADTDYLKKDKLTFSLTYRSRDRFSLAYDYEESVTDPESTETSAIARTANVDSDSNEEWCGKLQWSRSLSRQKVRSGEQLIYPRFDLSAEYIYADDDPDRQNRLVASASYLLALPGGMSLPLTLTYADKSEFLGEPDHQLNAHLGLSYKLDGLFGGN